MQHPDGSGEPIIRGLVKIDFNDDDAIDEMVADIADQYRAAAKAAGLKMAPRGFLVVISEGGVPVEEYRRKRDAMEAEYRVVLSAAHIHSYMLDMFPLVLVAKLYTRPARPAAPQLPSASDSERVEHGVHRLFDLGERTRSDAVRRQRKGKGDESFHRSGAALRKGHRRKVVPGFPDRD